MEGSPNWSTISTAWQTSRSSQGLRSNTMECLVTRACLSVFTQALCSLIASNPADG